VRLCDHGVEIPNGSGASRSPTCPACHHAFLAAASKRSYEQRQVMTEEEREAYLQYQRDYSKKNSVRNLARAKLWRAERRLIAALDGKGDEELIQKRRWELALLG